MNIKVRQPFERQIGESSKAFAAFVMYRDLGPSRTIGKCAQLMGKKEHNLSFFSTKYHWLERAQLWDDEQDRVRRDEQIETVRKMTERHANLALLLQSKVMERLQTLDPLDLKPLDIAKWLETSVKVERLSRGVSTENVEAKVGGSDGSPIKVEYSVDESATILETLANAGLLTAPDSGADNETVEVEQVHQADADAETSGVLISE